MTRSSPSYAKRCVCGGLALRPFIYSPIFKLQYCGYKQLPDAKGHAHCPGGECPLTASEGEAKQAGGEIPNADREHRARQELTRREYAETEYHLPNAWQHPETLRGVAHEHYGKQ